jgi:hypothetical protein
MPTVSDFLEPSHFLGWVANGTAPDVLFTGCHDVFK